VPAAIHFRLALQVASGVSRLSVTGDFDLAAVGSVENALDRAFEVPTPELVVLDLRRVTFLDAAGLRTILRANDRARAEVVGLVVVRPRGHASRVFTLTRAWQGLNMVDQPGEAVA
jgi:anti-anti-sigma factor